MPFGIGLMELVVIFFILLLIFGSKRLSGIGRGMGQAIRGFKSEVKDPDAPKEEAKALDGALKHVLPIA